MLSSPSNNIDIVDHLVEAIIAPKASGKQYVAIYIRYDDSTLQTSLQYQKEHYQAFLKKHPEWLLIGIYADEGLTEEKIANSRAALRELLKECSQGKITMVITWTVTNLSFHILECLILINKLLSMNPSVGIFFELQNYFSMNDSHHTPVHNHFLYLNIKDMYAVREKAYEEERTMHLQKMITDPNGKRRFN